MSEVQFFQTAMGRTYYERTMPALVAELARLNDLLAKLVEQGAKSHLAGSPGQETEQP